MKWLNFGLVLVSESWCLEMGLCYAAQADLELILLSPQIAGITGIVPAGLVPKVFLCGIRSSPLSVLDCSNKSLASPLKSPPQ